MSSHLWDWKLLGKNSQNRQKHPPLHTHLLLEAECAAWEESKVERRCISAHGQSSCSLGCSETLDWKKKKRKEKSYRRWLSESSSDPRFPAAGTWCSCCVSSLSPLWSLLHVALSPSCAALPSLGSTSHSSPAALQLLSLPKSHCSPGRCALLFWEFLLSLELLKLSVRATSDFHYLAEKGQ